LTLDKVIFDILSLKTINKKNNAQQLTSATRQVRQQWFSVGIFPPVGSTEYFVKKL